MKSRVTTVGKESGCSQPKDDDTSDQDCGFNNLFHVLFSTDSQQKVGLFALINSIVKNTNSPEKFFFHILVDDNASSYENIIENNFEVNFQYEVVSFKETKNYNKNLTFLNKNMRVYGPGSGARRTDNLMNFARFYLPEIFSDIRFGLYLDVDMIVQSDLAQLFDVELMSMVVASSLNRSLSDYNSILEISGRGFNAGLLLINFKRWREKNVTAEIKELMIRHKEIKLFRGGTQPLLNIVLHKKCLNLNDLWLDQLWHVTGLGRWKSKDPDKLKNGRVLHWNGQYKPWLEDGMNKEYWEKYRLVLD